MVVAALACAPGPLLADDKADRDDNKVDHQVRAEQRIKKMHAKLHLVSTQEEGWAKVAQVLRDNARVMDTLTQKRVDHAEKMSAVDDLQSYAEIAQAHVDGVHNMIPVFSELYASMTDAQKNAADALFRHGKHKHAHHKRDHKEGS
ncbi:MAG: Spy/CpxP family protein refolding chaperone [Magnetococcales bacterium]|nr:Spy/CpxP family protein refolding chaperone [Magnetococcales bacterium]